jgi:hypothetical protein
VSALRPTGSTRHWRTIVAYVLDHKGRRCLMDRDGHPCGAYATTVQHVVRREHGGGDDLANLIPACGPCNYGERPDRAAAAAALAAEALAAAGLTARQAAVVDALDACGLACTAGRRQAAALLARWALPLRASGGELDAACAYRRARGPLTRL